MTAYVSGRAQSQRSQYPRDALAIAATHRHHVIEMKECPVQCIVFPKGMHRSMRNVDKGLRAVGMLHKIDKMNARPRTEPNDLVEAR